MVFYGIEIFSSSSSKNRLNYWWIFISNENGLEYIIPSWKKYFLDIYQIKIWSLNYLLNMLSVVYFLQNVFDICMNLNIVYFQSYILNRIHTYPLIALISHILFHHRLDDNMYYKRIHYSHKMLAHLQYNNRHLCHICHQFLKFKF